jgi:hypothetical protein
MTRRIGEEKRLAFRPDIPVLTGAPGLSIPISPIQRFMFPYYNQKRRRTKQRLRFGRLLRAARKGLHDLKY